jgi:hypothetical protein
MADGKITIIVEENASKAARDFDKLDKSLNKGKRSAVGFAKSTVLPVLQRKLPINLM